MHPTSSQPPLAAICIGARARQLLSPGSGGQVLPGRSQAVHLRSGDGQILWLAQPEVPMHRRGIRLAGWSAFPSSGGSYCVSEGMQLNAPGLRLDLGAVPTWDPPALNRAQPRPSTDRVWGQHLALAVLSDLPEPHGFGACLPMILRSAGHEELPEPVGIFDTSLGEKGLRAALGVAQACRDGDLHRILLQAEDLVGLGDGLTPSGDDFLGGVLFGLAGLRQDGMEDNVSLRAFLGWARQRTNEISSQLLQDHAEGHGSEVLVHFAHGLLERWPVRAVLPAARALIGLGHSTGWSLMSGVWTALALFPLQHKQTLKQESSAGVPALG